MQSALLSAERAEEIGLARNRIILSAKVSAVQDLIAVYRRTRAPLRLRAASRPDRSRHGLEGHRRLGGRHGRAAAAGHRRHRARVADAGAERRPHARSAGGAGIVADHGAAYVCAAGRRLSRLRPHHLDHVPGTCVRHPKLHPRLRCRPGRRATRASRRSPSRSWAASSTGRARSKHADIGISLPGTGEQPTAPVFIDGKKVATLRGPTLTADFKQMVTDYIERRFGTGARAAE